MINQELVETKDANTSKNTFIPGISEPQEPHSTNITSEHQFTSHNEPQGTYDYVNKLFSDQNQEQQDILEAREILGDDAKELTDDQVFELINEVQFLVDSWVEEYEKDVFGGKTLDELLGLK